MNGADDPYGSRYQCGGVHPPTGPLLAGIAAIWGSSFLFMAIGLDAFRPGVVTLARVVLGTIALALVPRHGNRLTALIYLAWRRSVSSGLRSQSACSRSLNSGSTRRSQE